MILGLKTKLLAYLGIVGILGGLYAFQNLQVKNLKNDIAVLSENNVKLLSAIEIQSNTVDNLENYLQETIAYSQELNKELQTVRLNRNRLIQELDSFKGRLQDAAIKNPSAIERRANNAIRVLLRQFAADIEDQND